jgi:hypothetical protein
VERVDRCELLNEARLLRLPFGVFTGLLLVDPGGRPRLRGSGGGESMVSDGGEVDDAPSSSASDNTSSSSGGAPLRGQRKLKTDLDVRCEFETIQGWR